MSPGIFIVLEGLDGSGTTTQAERLVARCQAAGRAAHLTREPSTGPVGQLLRSILERRLDVGGFAPETMALLFAADRADHLQREVQPALARGEVVVCDRYVLSSLLYQSLTAPEPEAALPWLRQLNAVMARPTLTLVLHVDADTAAQRRAARAGQTELFEVPELQRKLADGYGRAAELLPGERVLLLDGTESLASVEEAIWGAVSSLLGA